MQTLSKEAEHRVIACAKEAVDLVDGQGMSPNAAVERIARREKMGAEMIRFLSHAYNTGRQTAQRETATNVLDKFADFPLVDPSAVISAVYPTAAATEKAAADLGTSAEYALPPQWTARRAQAEKTARFRGEREKAAADRAPASQPTRTGVEHVYNEHLTLKRAAEEARTKSGMACDRLLSTMGRLADYFRRSPHDRVKFAAAELAATAYHGTAGQRLMNYVYDRNGMKEARAADGRVPLVRVDRASAPFDMIEECVKLARVVTNNREAEKRAVDALEQHATTRLAPYVATPKVEKRAADSLIPVPDREYYDADSVRAFLPHRQRQVKAAAAAPAEKRAWNLLDGEPAASSGVGEKSAAGLVDTMKTRAAWGMMDNGMDALRGPSKTPNDRVSDAYLDLEDPAHEATLRQIRTQAMLADLMNDEVIGSHDPDDVARAYNEISQVAPRAAQQTIPARTMLSRHLSGRMEPHEAQQITSIESGTMGTHAPTPPELAPVPKPKPQQPQKAASSNSILDDHHAASPNSILC